MIGAHLPPTPQPGTFLDFNDVPPVAGRGLDKDDLRHRLLDQLEAVLVHLFPNGRRQGHRFLVGNVQGEAGDSLVVELAGPRRGLWIDFATGESGDVLALWAAVRGFLIPQDLGALLDDIGRWLAVPSPVAPLPAADNTREALGSPSAQWDYLSPEGVLLARVLRFDLPSGKQYRPWDPASGTCRMPVPRPLYNLPEVSRSTSVVLVEGEKCAEALRGIDIVATTSMGGARAPVEKTDWSPLSGKTVIVWPDQDEAGAAYADQAIPKLHSIGARVRRIVVPADKPPWGSPLNRTGGIHCQNGLPPRRQGLPEVTGRVPGLVPDRC